MDRISFNIFEPDGKEFHLTENWVIYGLWTVTIGFFWLFDNVIPGIDTVRTLVACCVGMLSIVFLVRSFFSYKALNGTLKGEIVFEDDCILINDKKVKLTIINDLDFNLVDYYGKRPMNNHGNFSPSLSQGVSNYVTFTDEFNQIHTFYFQLLTEHSYQSLAPFINAAIKVQKMQFKRGIDLVGIENVSID